MSSMAVRETTSLSRAARPLRRWRRMRPCSATSWHRACCQRVTATARCHCLIPMRPSRPCWRHRNTLDATLPWRMQMTTEAEARRADSGLEALLTLLHLQGVAADREQLRHRLGTATLCVSDIVRCARALGLKARIRRTQWMRLVAMPLPAIATLRDGGFMVIAKASAEKVLV